MSKIKTRPLLALAMVIMMSTISCAKEGSEAKQAPAKQKKVIKVKLLAIERETFIQRLTLPASAEASMEVTVSSETLARVEKLGFEKGNSLSRGDTLAWLDASSINAQLAQAEADRDMASLDYSKQKALKSRNANVSDFTLEKARLSLTSADARVAALRASLDKHMIKAPISGIAATKEVEAGAVVSPGAPITRILTLSPVNIVVGVPETAAPDFAMGKKADITFDAYPDKAFTATISYISAEVDSNSRVYDIELTLPNDDGLIKPKMSAKASFVRRSIEDSIIIPQTSILELATGHAVFVVDSKNIARQKSVEVEDYSEGRALIKSGLEGGELLVVLGQRNLIDGDKVEVEN